MQHTTLPFDVRIPDEPVLLDVAARYQRFARVPDQRHRRGKRLSLSLLLTIAVLGKLAGAATVAALAAPAQVRAAELQRLLRRPRATLPHPTTGHRMPRQTVNPQAFTQAGAEVLRPPTAAVPARSRLRLVLDGQTRWGTIPRGQTQGLHLLSAYLPATGVVLVQAVVDGTEHAITAAPCLLAHLDVTGLGVTGDAMQTQRAHSMQIVAQGGDYLWMVKEHQPRLRKERARLVAPGLVTARWAAPPVDSRMASTSAKGHGRLEERTITVRSLLVGYRDWPYRTQSLRVVPQRTARRTGTCTTAVRDGLDSQSATVADPVKLLAQVRGAMEHGDGLARAARWDAG